MFFLCTSVPLRCLATRCTKGKVTTFVAVIPRPPPPLPLCVFWDLLWCRSFSFLINLMLQLKNLFNFPDFCYVIYATGFIWWIFFYLGWRYIYLSFTWKLVWESFGWQRLYPRIRTSPNDAQRNVIGWEEFCAVYRSLYARIKSACQEGDLGLDSRSLPRLTCILSISWQ